MVPLKDALFYGERYSILETPLNGLPVVISMVTLQIHNEYKA